MEIVIAAVVVALGLAAGLVIAAGVLAKRSPGVVPATSQAPARRPVTPAVTTQKSPNVADGHAAAQLHAREETVEKRLAEVGERERRLGDRERQIEDTRQKAVRALEPPRFRTRGTGSRSAGPARRSAATRRPPGT